MARDDEVPVAMSRGRTASAAAVPVAFLLANATSYVLLLVAAHRLSSSAFGALSSLLGVLLIATIPMLALQTVAARRVAAGGGTAGIVRGSAQVAVLATGVLCVMSPFVAAFLHLPDLIGVLLVATTILPTAVLGTAMGIAQGRRRFLRLALLILAATGGRSLGGLVGLLIGGGPDAVLVGILIGTSSTAALVAAWGQSIGDHRKALGQAERTGVLREALHAGHAHGSFLLLTSLDVLLARHILTPAGAGVYAVGSVVTKAAVWLPQSMITLLFASLAQSQNHRAAARRGAAAVLAFGACGVAATALLGSVVVTAIGGAKYHQLDRTIWLFACVGALLAVLQLAVLAGLAQRNPRRAALLWITIGTDIAASLVVGPHATPVRLAVILLAVSAVSAAVSLWLTLRQDVDPAGHGPEVKVGSNPLPNLDAMPEANG